MKKQNKVHYKDDGYVACGTSNWGVKINLIQTESDVTCKKCLKFIKNRDSSKTYSVSYDWESWGGEYRAVDTVTAPTSSAAIYKVFKIHCWDDEQCISSSFKSFLKYANPKAKIDKDAIVSLTEEQKLEDKRNNLKEECGWWKENYPVGSKVLFQRDGASVCELKEVERDVFVISDYGLGIFLVGVSGYYHLAPAFVRPYKGNEHLVGKPLKDDG